MSLKYYCSWGALNDHYAEAVLLWREGLGNWCNIRYPPKSLFNSNLIHHNIHLNRYQIILKFCTEHGSITAVLYAKFQNDWATQEWIRDKRDFARFEFQMSLYPILQQPLNTRQKPSGMLLESWVQHLYNGRNATSLKSVALFVLLFVWG